MRSSPLTRWSSADGRRTEPLAGPDTPAGGPSTVMGPHLAFCRPHCGHSLAAARPLSGRGVAAVWLRIGRILAAYWPHIGLWLASGWPLVGLSMSARTISSICFIKTIFGFHGRYALTHTRSLTPYRGFRQSHAPSRKIPPDRNVAYCKQMRLCQGERRGRFRVWGERVIQTHGRGAGRPDPAVATRRRRRDHRRLG